MSELEKFLREALAKDELDSAMLSMMVQVHKPGAKLIRVPSEVYIELRNTAKKENKIPGYSYTKEKIAKTLLKIQMGDLV